MSQEDIVQSNNPKDRDTRTSSLFPRFRNPPVFPSPEDMNLTKGTSMLPKIRVRTPGTNTDQVEADNMNYRPRSPAVLQPTHYAASSATENTWFRSQQSQWEHLPPKHDASGKRILDVSLETPNERPRSQQSQWEHLRPKHDASGKRILDVSLETPNERPRKKAGTSSVTDSGNQMMEEKLRDF